MRVPGSVFGVVFACGTVRLHTSFGKAADDARHGGSTCCRAATLMSPCGASLVEYARVEFTQDKTGRRRIVDVAAIRERASQDRKERRERSARARLARRKGVLVVIDGGKR